MRIVLIVFLLLLVSSAFARAQETSANFAEGSVRIGFDSRTCDASLRGALRYHSANGCIEKCSGAEWSCTVAPECSDDSVTKCILPTTRTTGDPQFTAANIAAGVNILSVTGTLTSGGGTAEAIISPGNMHVCAMLENGPAWCWGESGNGRLGDGQTTTDRTRSVQVHTDSGAPGWIDWVEIKAAYYHTCGIRSTGKAYCWGEANSGKLGDGQTSTDRSRPVEVHTNSGSPGWSDWVSIGTGAGHTCGIRSTGKAYCWGWANNGQLGDGQTSTDRSRPVEVHTGSGSPGWSDWQSISTGIYHTCGIRTTGKAYCWGDSTGGALGDGQSTTDRVRPVEVHTDTGSPGWSDWAAISAGNGHTCGIRSNGTAWCWGWANKGKLGDGQTTTDRPRPVQVHTDTGSPGWSDWVSISAGYNHTCGVRGNGTAWCWGESDFGQLGDGQNTVDRSRPVQVHTDTGSPGWSDWVSISAGGANSCGIRSGNSAWCWGESSVGAIGDGQTTTDRMRPWAITAY